MDNIYQDSYYQQIDYHPRKIVKGEKHQNITRGQNQEFVSRFMPENNEYPSQQEYFQLQIPMLKLKQKAQLHQQPQQQNLDFQPHQNSFNSNHNNQNFSSTFYNYNMNSIMPGNTINSNINAYDFNNPFYGSKLVRENTTILDDWKQQQQSQFYQMQNKQYSQQKIKNLNQKRKLSSMYSDLPVSNARKQRRLDIEVQDFNQIYKSDFKVHTKNLIKGLMVKFADSSYAQLLIKQQEIEDNPNSIIYITQEYRNFIKYYIKSIKYTHQIRAIFSNYDEFSKEELQNEEDRESSNTSNENTWDDQRFERICEIIGGFQKKKDFKIDKELLIQNKDELESFNEQVSNINLYNKINRLCLQRYLTFMAANQIYMNTKIRENRSYNYYALSLRFKKIMRPHELQLVKSI